MSSGPHHSFKSCEESQQSEGLRLSSDGNTGSIRCLSDSIDSMPKSRIAERFFIKRSHHGFFTGTAFSI